jgi:hypothetical protein
VSSWDFRDVRLLERLNKLALGYVVHLEYVAEMLPARPGECS